MPGRSFALILIAGLLVVSGCGGDDASESTTTTTAETGMSATSISTTTAAGNDVASRPGSQEPGATTPPGPAATDPNGGPPTFTEFSVTADDCPTADVASDVSVTLPPFEGVVTMSWSVSGGFDSLYTAVDNPDGAFETAIPASGTRTFTRQCDSAHTYYVVAVTAGGVRVVKSQEVPAG